MPPNAEFRNRGRFANDGVDDIDAHDNNATETRIAPTKNLASTEIAIDGVIYDLTGFKHPGGDVVHLFGGNDVTVQYRMIHPRHNDKHLEKMTRVGKVSDYKPEYLFNTEFEREIKKEVFKIVRAGKEFGTLGYFFRAFTYIGIMAVLQYFWATTGSTWTLAVLLGISQASIGLNVQHDANHGAASRKPWVNDILGFGADMIGGSKWLWMEQHWTHHAFTNHADKDPDSFSAEPVMNFNDYPLQHSKRRFWHKFQGLYFLPLLSFYWLSSVFNPQIIDLQQRGAQSIGFNMENEFITKRRKYAVAIRLLYIYLNIVAPILINGFNITTVAQILTLGFAESLTLASLFALSHNFEGSDRDPTASFRKTGEPVCWFKSQVETSSTYGGFISGALTGGLNFQVEHHLFPRMSSAWYPYIAPKVREICKKHGVHYAYYPWMWQNFISTIKYMHAVGVGSHWDDHLQPLSGKN
mmetsp:Transcript_9954/g.13939  ORF Transcript_9954/g.13939 Transcript_9954/m.13939 type:complete len:468 (-) Transcript_9954:114-1517(-)|eukprot:CAMPEP_0185732340 /NCGR_PEP_ID=MMETSP1171-20130828/15829_1 /TAXON_ID=374046 /ORGANISM="Helicotheca tamensis, Strain CCMP826" /LENGTH=467 /DNA_ID=CAMNT_0028401799 /DNA_START=97 /DNA_END=1500 /DNA_ORIENTATION=-